MNVPNVTNKIFPGFELSPTFYANFFLFSGVESLNVELQVGLGLQHSPALHTETLSLHLVERLLVHGQTLLSL